jgi:hypothetical protein
MKSSRLPRLPVFLLRFFLPSTEHATVLGELSEEYLDEELPIRGPIRAYIWFWGECVSLSLAYLWAAVARGRSREITVIMDARRLRRRSTVYGPSRERGGRFESVRQDLRHGMRSLARRPAFTVAALLTIAIGIGANATILSILQGTMLKPLPFEEPDRLVSLYEMLPEYGVSRAGVSPPNLQDWRRENRVFEQIAAYRTDDVTIADGGEPERLQASKIEAGLFSVLGIQPSLGRGFLEQEEEYGSPGVLILGHGVWQRRFGSDPGVLGKDVNLDGERLQVVGIAPAGFRFPNQSDIFLPLRIEPDVGRSDHMLWAVARLRDDITLDEALADIQSIENRISEQYPETSEGVRAGMMSLHSSFYDELTGPLLLFYGIVCLVLLLACANTANLMLALFTTYPSRSRTTSTSTLMSRPSACWLV